MSMKLAQYLKENKAQNTKPTTFYHEVSCAIFCVAPTAKLVTGRDILSYMSSVTPEGFISVSKSSSRSYNPTGGPYEIFLTDDKISSAMLKRVNDAKQIASVLRGKLGNPSEVYWTGPSNSGTKYGAADIVLISSTGEHPVSLKYDSGQLKNLSLRTLSTSLMKGVFEKGTDLVTTLRGPEYTKSWNGMTKDWLKYLYDNGMTPLATKLNLDWKSYLDAKVTDEDLEAMKLLNWGKANPKYTGKDSTLLRYWCRKYYESLPFNAHKEWKEIRLKYFDELFGGFFSDNSEKIKDNLRRFYARQMSIGVNSLWYAAEGGKKVLYIPSYREFIVKTENVFTYTSESSADNNGYKISLHVNDLSVKPSQVVTVHVDIRWATGQMNGEPTTKSSLVMNKDNQEYWNNLFMPDL